MPRQFEQEQRTPYPESSGRNGARYEMSSGTRSKNPDRAAWLARELDHAIDTDPVRREHMDRAVGIVRGTHIGSVAINLWVANGDITATQAEQHYPGYKREKVHIAGRKKPM